MKKKVRPIKRRSRALVIAASLSFAIFVGAFGIALYNYPGHDILGAFNTLANPYIKAVAIDPGMRREQVAERFAKAFNWTEIEKNDFVRIHTAANEGNVEGYYFPGTYILPIYAKPHEVSAAIVTRFKERILNNKTQLKNNIINIDTAVKIASIIEREAGSKRDMKIISGVIWNRLFQGMSLDMDATLQYAKGTPNRWWPLVVGADRRIDSPYNTYKYKGFPPTPISSPSEDAIWAALNPTKTDVLFYIHDDSGVMHTAKTYSEQVANISRYF